MSMGIEVTSKVDGLGACAFQWIRMGDERVESACVGLHVMVHVDMIAS